MALNIAGTTDSFWCGGSLRPWQILHAKLAQLEDGLISSELDVWELMDETVEAAYSHRKLKEQDKFNDDDDEELWRHGGLMEVKVRDWLASKMAENDERNCYYSNTAARYTNHSQYDEHASCKGLVYEELYEEDDQYTDGGTNINYTANLAVPLNIEPCYSQSYNIVEDQYWVEPAYREMKGDDEMNYQGDEVCAVCLDNLFDEPASGGVTRLQCRHSFHSLCLSPWLDSSSCCPCCRAPTTCDNFLAGPADMEAISGAHADMMGLLVDIEAALGRFGFLP